ncbi:hypothetical protein [Aurantimonas sp. A3-2-R12]|uniref:hypothetical protein n=1 Tax=Aurantimonas sp. A3-2-R12 TaxID=3114362 RepID=UPI002E199AE5|nr:hypothetical protein [Aurantimonas sp. A3-2-R12]
MNDAEMTSEDGGSEASTEAPNPEDFDPNSEVYWTLPMVLAWIVYRDSGEVRQMWDQYRSRCMDDAGTATVSLLHIAFLVNEDERSIAMSPAKAERALLGTLAVGSIAAWGIPLDGELRVEIPESEWADFGFFEGTGSRDEVRAGPFGHGYHSVLLKSRAVRQAWPAIQPPVPFSYEIDELERLPLFQAVIWCATGGAETTNEEVEQLGYISQGEKILFPLLARGNIAATGERPGDLIREDIPKSFWERAASERADDLIHFVDYTRDGIEPFGATAMRWHSIKIEFSALRSEIFPHASPDARTVSGQKRRRRKGGQIASVLEIIKDEFPDGLTGSISNRAVNERIKKRLSPETSPKSIQRAIGEARSGQEGH